jgi:hypothetical protein
VCLIFYHQLDVYISKGHMLQQCSSSLLSATAAVTAAIAITIVITIAIAIATATTAAAAGRLWRHWHWHVHRCEALVVPVAGPVVHRDLRSTGHVLRQHLHRYSTSTMRASARMSTSMSMQDRTGEKGSEHSSMAGGDKTRVCLLEQGGRIATASAAANTTTYYLYYLHKPHESSRPPAHARRPRRAAASGSRSALRFRIPSR